jgi:hypothetical protein
MLKESNLLSVIKTIGSVTIETNLSDMKYQPPKALQAQSKYRAIKPAKFEFDSKIMTGNVTMASSLSGTITISLGLPSKLILLSCLPSSDNTITSVLILLHTNK